MVNMEASGQIEEAKIVENENSADDRGLTEEGVPGNICLRNEQGCGSGMTPARNLLIVHPSAAENTKPDCFTIGLKGYGVPYQHPLFTTSNAVYGRHAPPPGLNKKRFPRQAKFTTGTWKCGVYEDFHLTTEISYTSVYKSKKKMILLSDIGFISVPYCTILYHTVSYCIILHHTVPYCIILYQYV
ncbi:hypothetical protein Btru_040929 [Bulinus truncatus]|nr:hypothetical protein Btru_040929 [Bulinus truncatus]